MAMAFWRRLRSAPRDVLLALPIMATHSFCYYGVFAVAFNLYLVRLGFGPEFIGRINAIPPLTFALLGIPSGLLARRWSCRRMMWLGKLVDSLGVTAAALAFVLPEQVRTAWITGGMICFGVGAAIWFVNYNPFLVGASGVDFRGHAIGLSAAIATIAGMTGSLLGGVIPGLMAAAMGAGESDPAPFGLTVAASALLQLLSIPPMLRARTMGLPSETGRPERSSGFPWLAMGVFALAVLLSNLARASGSYFVNVYLDTELDAPTALIGVLAALPSMISIPASLSIPWIVGRWGRAGGFLRTNTARALAFLIYASVAHWAAIGAGRLVMAGAGMCGNILTMYSLEQVEPEWRPTLQGATMLALGLGMAGMAALGGMIAARWGYRPVFAVAAAATMLLSLLIWAYARFGERCQRSTEGAWR